MLAFSQQMSGIKLYGAILIVPALLLILSLLWGDLERQRLEQFDHVITIASDRYDIPEALIRAVIWRESRFQPDAIGQAGERGLMQVMPPAASEWADHEDIQNFDPEFLLQPRINILAGSWYLARAARRWPDADNPYVFGLAEYNAGRVHARRWARDLPSHDANAFIEQIDFPTTRQYIIDVLERYEYYRNHSEPTSLSVVIDQVRSLWFRWREEQELQLSE